MSQPTPTLLQYLYGLAGDDSLQSASPRLLAWCRAFDDWLAYRKASSRTAYYTAQRSWRRLAAQTRKPPWELDQDDLEEHVRWLRDKGFTISTVRGYISAISHFYRWCDQRRIDPACPPGFNPALDLDQLKGRARPAASARPTLAALNREEARALLSLLRQDSTLFGQRDYAFFVARLRLGVGLEALRSLRWGQIEADETGARVRWRQPIQTQPQDKPQVSSHDEPKISHHPEAKVLPQDAWQAILRYLRAAGRLETIQPHDYIFAPMRDDLAQNPAGLAEDWNPARCMTAHHWWRILKLYGEAAGIPEEKLTLPVLRRTAVLLRLEAGDALEEIQSFMDSSAQPNTTKQLLRRLPALAGPDPRPPSPDPATPDPATPSRRPDSPAAQEQETRLAIVPQRGRNIFILTHGLYARQQPPEEVASMLAENVKGIDQELAGLRLLGRGLMERLGQAASSSEAARLGRAYAQLTSRMTDLVSQEQAIKEVSGTSQIERTLAYWSHCWSKDNESLLHVDPQDGSELSTRSLVEETASLRVVLRRTLQLALQAQDNQEYARLVDLFGYGCMRLVRLLKSKLVETELLQKAIDEAMFAAIDIVLAEIEEEKALEKEGAWVKPEPVPYEELFSPLSLANQDAYFNASEREREAMIERWVEEDRQKG